MLRRRCEILRTRMMEWDVDEKGNEEGKEEKGRGFKCRW